MNSILLNTINIIYTTTSSKCVCFCCYLQSSCTLSTGSTLSTSSSGSTLSAGCTGSTLNTLRTLSTSGTLSAGCTRRTRVVYNLRRCNTSKGSTRTTKGCGTYYSCSATIKCNCRPNINCLR